MGKRILIIIIITGLVFFLCWLFIPHRSILAQQSGGRDEIVNQTFSEFYIKFKTSDDEILSGWFFNRGEGTPLVVCYSGNSCNASMFIPYAQQDMSRSYLMINYRGYGNSTGRLKEDNMVSDACEALKYYTAELGTHDVILLGFSLGTGVAVQVASRTPQVDKLVLAAPFDSMAAICGVTGIRKFFLKDHFNSVDYAPLIKCPVHVVYSLTDSVVRAENTQNLLKAFKCPLTVQKVHGEHSEVISNLYNMNLIINALNLQE